MKAHDKSIRTAREVFNRYNAARQTEAEAFKSTPEGKAQTLAHNKRVLAALRAKRVKSNPDSAGWYVWGKSTSVAWFKSKAEAEAEAKRMNYRGGQHYTVQRVKSNPAPHPKAAKYGLDTMYAEQSGDGYYSAWTYSDGNRVPLFSGKSVMLETLQNYAERHRFAIVYVNPSRSDRDMLRDISDDYKKRIVGTRSDERAHLMEQGWITVTIDGDRALMAFPLTRAAGKKNPGKRNLKGGIGKSPFQRMKDAGVLVESNATDMYVPVTAQTRKIIAELKRDGWIIADKSFVSHIDNTLWIELPFYYEPGWKKNPGSRSSKAVAIFARKQSGTGPIMFYDGSKFTNNGKPQTYKTGDAAWKRALQLKKKFSILKDYSLLIALSNTSAKDLEGILPGKI